jgi:hypothetical protein
MVQFQKLKRIHQQLRLSKFLMCHQQFDSRAYCWVAGPVSKMVSQQEKAFCVLRVEVCRFVINAALDSCSKQENLAAGST